MPYTTTTDGARIRWEEHGAGEATVVLVHGQGGSFRNWDPNAPAIAEAGYRVITPELRPHQYSETPDGADLSAARLAQDIVEILDELGIEQVHIGGWSLGGLITQQFAHDHPERTLSIGLFNTFADWSHGPWWRFIPFRLNIAAIKVMRRMPVDKLENLQRKSVRDKLLLPQTRAAHPEVCQAFEDEIVANTANPELNRLILGTTARFNSRPWLPGMDVPALIIAGGKDHVPLYMPEDMQALLPRAEMDFWPDGTHMIAWDDTAGFNGAYLDFLDRAVSDAVVAGAHRDHHLPGVPAPADA